ncbi:MAG: succinate dehydrogenase assembly factor 2 [Rhodobacteraceae bacterium]|nr:succinate dehydrogenase assembly factor 2 [Paracoccaceae bacterium]
MTETPEARIKRMKMRSMRRGIKEMDLILSGFADRMLDGLSEDDLSIYDALLSENDHDLYQWVSGQTSTPPQYLDIMTRIAACQRESVGKDPSAV